MDIPWGRTSSIERQAAAADLWMELTGRKQAAAFSSGREALEKRASAAPPPQNPPPRLAPAAATGAVAGGALGAGAGAALARKAGTKLTHTMLGAGGVGAGLGAAAGLGVGISKLKKHYQQKRAAAKLSPLQKRLVGGTAGALAAGAGGGLFHYLQARPDASGKSKHERGQEAELARLNALFDGDLRGTAAMKERYHQMLLDHTRDAKRSPGKTALVGSVPYAVSGGLLGAHLAPRVL